jgi:hypothetical protein
VAFSRLSNCCSGVVTVADQRISEQQLQALDDADEYSLRHHSSEVSLLISSYRDLLVEVERLHAKLDSIGIEASALSRMYTDGMPERERFEHLVGMAMEGKTHG